MSHDLDHLHSQPKSWPKSSRDDQGLWWNYVTGELEQLEGELTDDNAKRYLPQFDAAQALYDVYRELGESVLAAMVRVLTVVINASINRKP